MRVENRELEVSKLKIDFYTRAFSICDTSVHHYPASGGILMRKYVFFSYFFKNLMKSTIGSRLFSIFRRTYVKYSKTNGKKVRMKEDEHVRLF